MGKSYRDAHLSFIFDQSATISSTFYTAGIIIGDEDILVIK